MSNETKHTPGPWAVSGTINARYISGIGEVQLIRRAAVGDDRYVAIATLDAMGNDYNIETSAEERAANAKLIAAAPDLLKAAGVAVAVLSLAHGENHLAVADLRAAIAKATQSTVQ